MLNDYLLLDVTAFEYFLFFWKFRVLEFFQEFVLNHDSKTFMGELG